MVSAVDTRGKIVYRGTSASQKTPMSQKQHRSVQQREAGDVLSVKKSTEIAAMFSNLKLNQTTDIIIDQSTAEETDASELSTDDAYSSMKYRVDRGRNRNGFSKSMENSLGYLPWNHPPSPDTSSLFLCSVHKDIEEETNVIRNSIV